MSITLNVTLQHGVRKTVIIQQPVLCHPSWMSNARTDSLITNNVKKTGQELAENKVMSTLVLPDVFMPQQNAARGIILMVRVVLLHRRQAVHPITKSPATRPADRREPIPAVILVTAAVMTTVRPVLLKIIPVLMLLQLNAGQDVTDVKTVLQAVPLTPALTLDLPNAVLVINVMTTVNPVRSPYLVLLLM